MIRRALEDDVEQILGELKRFASFYGTRRSLFPSDPALARDVVSKLIRDHLFFVSVDMDNRVQGFIAGFVSEHVFNPEIVVLAESLWWVAERDRGTRVGADLLHAFTDWGKENVDWITMTLEHHSPIKPSTLLRRGFRLQEASYLMEI